MYGYAKKKEPWREKRSSEESQKGEGNVSAGLLALWQGKRRLRKKADEIKKHLEEDPISGEKRGGYGRSSWTEGGGAWRRRSSVSIRKSLLKGQSRETVKYGKGS